jgi:drug/metabolite transporter (DMT)-like permease
MFKNLSDQITGILFIFLSACMYATMPILAKVGYSLGLTPGITLFLRFFFAFIIISSYLMVIKREPVLCKSIWVIAQGLLFVFRSLLYFFALKYIPAGITSVIFFVYPVEVAALSLLIFKEKPTSHLFLGMFLAITGIALISGIGQGFASISIPGLLLAIASSLSYCGYVIIGQRNVASVSTLSLTATFSAVGLLVFSVYNYQELSFISSLNGPQLMIGLIMGLFNTVLAAVFFLKGLGKIGASRAALISSLEPVITIMIAYLVLGEILNFTKLLGSFLVIASMFLAVTSQGEKKQPTNSPQAL